jgi:hypothetical protein
MPSTSPARMTAISSRVSAALRDSGDLNAATPSEIASTPVSAEQPRANAVRMTSQLSAYRAFAIGRVGRRVNITREAA